MHIRVASPRLWKLATLRGMGSDSAGAAAAAYYRDEGGRGGPTARDARRPLIPPELDPAGPWPTLQRVASPESPTPDTVPGMRGDPDNRPILVITGLAMEARIAAGPGVEVVCSGCDPMRLRDLLSGLTPARYRGVISFGVSGALDPALQPGDTVVATEIRSDSDAWPIASAFAQSVTGRLRHNGGNATPNGVSWGTLAGVNAPVMEAPSKAALRHRTGAAAVDMESHVAASFGAAAGLPVCALRVISDPADRALPPLATRALKANGSVDLAAIFGSLAGNPRQLPLLIQAGRDARIAFAALRRVRRLLELGLGFGGANLR